MQGALRDPRKQLQYETMPRRTKPMFADRLRCRLNACSSSLLPLIVWISQGRSADPRQRKYAAMVLAIRPVACVSARSHQPHRQTRPDPSGTIGAHDNLASVALVPLPCIPDVQEIQLVRDLQERFAALGPHVEHRIGPKQPASRMRPCSSTLAWGISVVTSQSTPWACSQGMSRPIMPRFAAPSAMTHATFGSG